MPIGIYPFSPADEDYICVRDLPCSTKWRSSWETRWSVPLSRSVRVVRLLRITYDGRKIDGYFISYHELIRGKELVITTE